MTRLTDRMRREQAGRKPTRVYEFQRRYDVSMQDTLEAVRSLGIPIRNYMHKLSDEEAQRVAAHFEESYDRRPEFRPRPAVLRRGGAVAGEDHSGTKGLP